MFVRSSQLFGLVFLLARRAFTQIGVQYAQRHWLVHARVFGAFACAMFGPALGHIIANAAIQSAVGTQNQIHAPIARVGMVFRNCIHHMSIAIFKRPVNLSQKQRQPKLPLLSSSVFFKPFLIGNACDFDAFDALADFFYHAKAPLVVIDAVAHFWYCLQFVHDEASHGMEIGFVVLRW